MFFWIWDDYWILYQLRSFKFDICVVSFGQEHFKSPWDTASSHWSGPSGAIEDRVKFMISAMDFSEQPVFWTLVGGEQKDGAISP